MGNSTKPEQSNQVHFIYDKFEIHLFNPDLQTSCKDIIRTVIALKDYDSIREFAKKGSIRNVINNVGLINGQINIPEEDHDIDDWVDEMTDSQANKIVKLIGAMNQIRSEL